MRLAKSFLLCVSLEAMIAAVPVLAAPAARGTAAQAEPSEAGEIVVTAQKREENINKVGLSIAAIGAATLKERVIQSLSDVAAAVPGLSYVNSANNTPVYNLRGVGFYDTSLGSYPTTSVYLDQVPLPFPVMTNLTAFDLERIEVLKGPQGTLFGQNSTGGAINYIAAKPTSHFAAGGQASFGRWNDFVGSAYLSGPLSDTVRMRIAVQGEKSGPWQYSYTRPNGPDNKNGRNNNIAGRFLVDWDAASNLNFELNVNGWIDKNQPEAVQYSRFNQQAITNVSPAVRNYPLAPADPRAADWSTNNGMYRDVKFGQVSLRGDWGFTDNVALTSITSYISLSERGALDQDGINFSGIDLRGFIGTIKSFSQELRIANKNNKIFRWVVGGNFSRDHVYYDENLVYGDGSGGNNQSPPFQIESSENFSKQHMKNYAAFGNIDWSPVAQLTVKGGVRWTRAERTADICNLDGSLNQGTVFGGPSDRNFPVGGVNRLFTLLQNIFAPGNSYGAIQPGQCFNLNDPSPLNVNQNHQGAWQAGLFTSALNETNVSWRAGIDYKPADNVLLYALVAKGYKAGGFGNINAAIDFQFRPVKQESVLDYEGGFKVQLANRKISINGAAFYMDYKNKQLRTKDVNPIFGIIDALNNIPKSHITGGELELNVRPLAGLDFGADVTYLETKITSYTGTNADGNTSDFAGSLIPFTPKWQFVVHGRYETPITSTLAVFVGAQLNHRSRTNAEIGSGLVNANGISLASGFEIPAYTSVDAQFGIKSAQGWRAQVWGKNLTNSYYWTNVVAGQDEIVRYAAKPVSCGVTLGIDF